MPGDAGTLIRPRSRAALLARRWRAGLAPAGWLFLLLVIRAAPASGSPAGTLDRLADGFDAAAAQAVEGTDRGQLDLALWLGSAPGVKAELVAVIGDLLLARLNRQGFNSIMRIEGGGTSEVRRTRARRVGCERLLAIEVSVSEGYLHLKGVLVDTERHLWRDVLQPEQGALHHLHSRVRIDAEVRAYQGRAAAGPPQFAPRGFRIKGQRILAAAVSDVNGDGRSEVAVLHPRELKLYLFEGGAAGFREVHTLKLTPPWAGVRSRRCVGTLIAVDRDGDGADELVARTSEMPRAQVVELQERKLARKAELNGYPQAAVSTGEGKTGPVEVVAQLADGTDLFDSTTLAPPLAPALQQGLTATFYRMKAAVLPSRKSGPVVYRGVLDDKGGLRVYRGDSANMVAYLQGRGLAFELLDVDDDGVLDVVTTGAESSSSPDRVVVHRASNLASPLWQSGPLQGVVSALTYGDIDGDGRLEVIAVVMEDSGAIELKVLN